MTGSGRRPWTDEEFGFIQDHDDWPSRRIAAELGRTTLAVEKKRRKLKEGWEPKQNPEWTAEEDSFILANLRMQAVDVGAHLGRTKSSVITRRTRLRKRGALRGECGGFWSPTSIGSRPLLAQTCPACGLLLQAQWFSGGQGGRMRTCRRCYWLKMPKGPRTDKARQQSRDSAARFQERTIPGAVKSGDPWTETDMNVLRDHDMTILQKALILRRTYRATQIACSRYGFKSKVGLGDPERDQWKIDNPNAAAFAA